MGRLALVVVLLGGGCHRQPSAANATHAPASPELEQLRAEQDALKARLEALQAKVEQQAHPELPSMGTTGTIPAPTPDAAPTRSTTPSGSPTPSVTADPNPYPVPSPATLKIEDLHGAPPTATDLVTGAATPVDPQTAALLEQLKGQLDQAKKSLADQQSVLDQLENMK